MIEIKNITTGYGKQTVLEDIGVSIEKGRLTSIIGVNGSGKSTFLKAILGILPLRNGSISIDGAELSSLKRNEIAQRVAYLSQGKSTPDMTVEQMVLHGRFPYLSYPRRYTENDRKIAFSAMERVGICELAGKPLHTLSGGMRQNAYIAMALAQDTDYILLDEPTTYLDIAHQLELMHILRALADSGKGIVTVMHDLPLAFDFSDEIVLMANKTSLIKAPPAEMCKSPVIQELFGVQIKKMAEEERYYYTMRR